MRELLLILAFSMVAAAPPAASESEADTLYDQGSRALRARNYEQATAQLERAAELRGDHAETWLKLGIAYAGLERWDAAIEAYGRLIDLDPAHAKAHHNLGNVYFRRGDFEPAAAAYGKSLELDPDYLLAAFHLGWTLRQLGRSTEAEQAFDRCLEIGGDDARAQRTKVDCTFGLGSIRHRARDYEASARMMEQVLAVHPGHPEARYYLGMAYRQTGRLQEAANQLEIHRRMLSAKRQPLPQFDDTAEP
jgi:tetratricopeptide (TPR) repeat protein